MTAFSIRDIARLRPAGTRVGVTSVCTAHPPAIGAALLQEAADGAPVLIEATCDQVSQDGGYTGMTPDAVRHFVLGMAAGVGFDPAGLVLATVGVHRRAFAATGLDEAFSRAVGVVVQPGVAFADADVVACDPAAARDPAVASVRAALAPYSAACGAP